jgi:C1A family cysteine protease
MDRRIRSVLAAFVLAATAISLLPITSAAQTPNPPDSDSVDPPDTVYHTGAIPENPEVDRRRSMVQHHRAFLPTSIDLSSRMPAVGDQGRLGSCGAWAIAYAARSYYTGALENRNIKQSANLPSPNYVYHLARRGDCDAGSNLSQIVDVLKNGALSLSDYPYTDACTPPALPDLVSRAHDFRVLGANRVDISQPDDIKGQLAQSNPVMIVFHDSTAWQRLRGARTFKETAPPPDDKIQGWHFMTIVGYDERRQAFRLINSWSKGWGDHGYAWMSYDLLQTRIKAAYVLNVGPSQQAVVPPGPQPQPSPTPSPVPPIQGLQLTDLQSLSCGRVTVEPHGEQSILSGYVATDDDLKKVKSIAANVPNVSLGNVIVAPWPQCEALQTLEKPLGVAGRPAIDIGPTTELHDGDPLKIQVRSPGQISFLYVSYIQADGSVVHLVQPNGLVPQPTLPGQTLVFGSGEEGKPKFTISAPFGREMIVAIASRSPLFDHELPQHETERDYLSELRRALIYKPVPDMPDRELAATITTLQTTTR